MPSQPSGGGARRRRSVLLSNASHPLRISPGRDARGSRCFRRSTVGGWPGGVSRRSASVGYTSQTSQMRPSLSVNVRCATDEPSGFAYDLELSRRVAWVASRHACDSYRELRSRRGEGFAMGGGAVRASEKPRGIYGVLPNDRCDYSNRGIRRQLVYADPKSHFVHAQPGGKGRNVPLAAQEAPDARSDFAVGRGCHAPIQSKDRSCLTHSISRSRPSRSA